MIKILFIDDSLDTRELYSLVFRLAGHTVQMGADGSEAVEAVRKESYDVLIIDVEMPVMNGWDAVRSIRKLENGAQLPIIMFTAYATGTEQKRVEEVGANVLLHKPVIPSAMLGHINTLVDAGKGEPMPSVTA